MRQTLKETLVLSLVYSAFGLEKPAFYGKWKKTKERCTMQSETEKY